MGLVGSIVASVNPKGLRKPLAIAAWLNNIFCADELLVFWFWRPIRESLIYYE